jgi:hypothetical protein
MLKEPDATSRAKGTSDMAVRIALNGYGARRNPAKLPWKERALSRLP